jgi:hypothetical protein
MATLEEHVAKRLQNPDFKRAYEGWCEACPVTMDLCSRVHAEGLHIGDLALRIEVEKDRLAALLDADCCAYDVVERLCGHFGLTPPKSCPRGPCAARRPQNPPSP